MVTAKTVDFTNVKEGAAFNKRRVREGDYLARVTKVEDAVSKADDTFQYLFTVQLVKYPRYKYPYYCKLQENQLWKLKNLLAAAGVSVPKGKFKVNPTKVVGKMIGVAMIDDEYEGREQSAIDGVFPASELSEGKVEIDTDDTDDDEGEAGVDDDEQELDVEEAQDDDEDEDEDSDEEDEFSEMDRDKLKRYIRKHEEGAKISRSESDDDLRTRARALAAGDDEEEADDEEDEEEPPPPPKKKSKKSAASAKSGKKSTKKATPVVEDDDLEELDIDDEL